MTGAPRKDLHVPLGYYEYGLRDSFFNIYIYI